MVIIMERKEQAPSIWNRTFIAVLICQVLVSLSSYIVNPLVSSYAAFMGADILLVGVMTSLYFGCALAMRPFSGPAVVKLDKRKLLLFAFALGAAVNFCYATFTTIPAFMVTRAIQGIQFSIIGALLMTIASDSLPRESFGAGIGMYGIASAISTAVGPSIGLAVRSWGTERFGEIGGYRAIFYLATAIFLVALIPAFFIKIKKCSTDKIASTGAWYKNILATASIPSAVCVMFFNIAYSLYSAYMVPYAAQKGFEGISIYFTIQAFVMIVFRPAAGKLVDKFGAASVVYPSVFFFSVSLVLLWRAQSIGVVYAAAVFAALGYGMGYPAFQAQCLQCVPSIKRGVASNTNYIGTDLGLFLGPILGGLVIKNFNAGGNSYSIMFLFAVLPVLLAADIFIVSRKSVTAKIKEVERQELAEEEAAAALAAEAAAAEAAAAEAEAAPAESEAPVSEPPSES